MGDCIRLKGTAAMCAEQHNQSTVTNQTSSAMSQARLGVQ